MRGTAEYNKHQRDLTNRTKLSHQTDSVQESQKGHMEQVRELTKLTWRRYYTSPEDKKSTTKDTEVLARHV